MKARDWRIKLLPKRTGCTKVLRCLHALREKATGAFILLPAGENPDPIKAELDKFGKWEILYLEEIECSPQVKANQAYRNRIRAKLRSAAAYA